MRLKDMDNIPDDTRIGYVIQDFAAKICNGESLLYRVTTKVLGKEDVNFFSSFIAAEKHILDGLTKSAANDQEIEFLLHALKHKDLLVTLLRIADGLDVELAELFASRRTVRRK